MPDKTRIAFNHDNNTQPALVTHALAVQLETMEYRLLLKKVRSMPTSSYKVLRCVRPAGGACSTEWNMSLRLRDTLAS